jgi:hypothetical protein
MSSATALGISDLFAILNEAQPRQTNIILDACQSGGVVVDLPSVLKPDIIGGSQTPGISIFASSALDEYSGDTKDGGVGTIHLLRCIEGNEIVQTVRPTLDLVEVGRVASEIISAKYPEQTPVCWALISLARRDFVKIRITTAMLPIPSLQSLVSSEDQKRAT